jgi:myo-inositol catabolism protein IolS
MSRVAFGCWAIGGHGYGKVDDVTSISAIHAALDVGINCFDTSDVYGFGHSESVLGRALRFRGRDVVVATKFGVGWDEQGRTYKDCSPKHIVSALDASLRRLHLDAITLYQLNWHDGITPLEQIVETLERCRAAGKIRYMGFSNMRGQEWGERLHHFSSSQLPYGLNQRSYTAEIDRLRSRGMSVLVYNVLSRGLFAREHEDRAVFGEADTRARDPEFSERLRANQDIYAALKVIGDKYGKTPAQVAVRWALDTPGVTCALVGMKTERQVLENVGAAGWQLDTDDWAGLARLPHNAGPPNADG